MSLLLRAYPEMTETLCSYLRALSTAAPHHVAAQVEQVVRKRHSSEWELAHLVRTLLHVPASVSDNTMRILRKRIRAPYGQWLAVVEILKLLAARGELDHDTVGTIWNTCPHVFRVDVVDAVKRYGYGGPMGTSLRFRGQAGSHTGGCGGARRRLIRTGFSPCRLNPPPTLPMLESRRRTESLRDRY